MTGPDLTHCAKCGQPHTRCSGHVKNGPRKGQPCMRYPKAGAAVCRGCGGAAPQVKAAAERRLVAQAAADAAATYGLPREVEPAQALLEEVHRTAGHVAWLAQVVADLQHDGDGYSRETTDDGEEVLRPRSGLKQLDQSGKFEKPSVWVELYQAERKHLTAVAKAAVDAGIAEREIHVVERHADQIVAVIRGIFTRLGIDASPGTQAAEAAQAELRALVGGGQ